jgi:hypothetical protein
VLPFFQALGVPGSGGQEEEQDAATRRRLVACDVVLYQDRNGTRTEWELGNGVDGQIAQFSLVTTVKANARKAAYVRAMSRWLKPVPASRAQMIRGDWNDATEDQELVATVYLVSPQGAGGEAVPDGSWVAHAKQGEGMFWNLGHGTNLLRPPAARTNLSLTTGLAGGVGDPLIAVILAQVNDQASAVAELIGRERIEGKFWSV